MKRLEKLLVYVDDLGTLDGILDMVSEIVEGTACRVVFASVIEPLSWGVRQAISEDVDSWTSTQAKALAKEIEGAIAALRKHGVDAEVAVYAGEPTRTLVNVIVDQGFDVLVKAAQTEGWPRGGSSDQRILRHCPCPVAILRPPTPDQPHKIMAAIEMNPDDPDDNAVNDEIMDAAIRTAMGYFSQLVVVHAWHLQGEPMLANGFARLPRAKIDALREDERQHHRRWLESYVDRYVGGLGPEAKRYLKPEIRLVQGLPTQALVRQVETEKPELLVLGSVARTGIQGLLIGNTAESLVSQVPCSTLTVKPAGFQSPLMD